MDRLWAMQVFVRVVECGSFSRAAESLDIANATVTSSVRNLENYLGVTLLSRSTRSLRLTDDGEGYFEQCNQVLQQIADMEAQVRQKKDEISGQLCIESPAAFARTLLLSGAAGIYRATPGLSVALRQTDHAEDLIATGTDVAIRIDSVNDADLVARPLYQAHYVACAAPACSNGSALPNARRSCNRSTAWAFSAPVATPYRTGHLPARTSITN